MLKLPQSSQPQTLNGFTPLKILYPGKVAHYIYVRKHETSSKQQDNPQLPIDRTIFLVNVPPDANQRDFTKLFGACGLVERVVFSRGAGEREDPPSTDVAQTVEADDSDDEEMVQEHAVTHAPKIVPLPSNNLRQYRSTGQTAHVVFLEKDAVQKVPEMALRSTEEPVKWPKLSHSEAPTGLAHYIQKYKSSRPPLGVVKAHADSSLEAFEHLRMAALQAQTKKANTTSGAEVDDEGWTVVTREKGARSGGVGVVTKDFQMAIQHGEQNEAAAKLKAQQEKLHKKDFYTFQVREKKRSAFMEVRKQFEHEKVKIEKLKAKRKFKTY